MCSPSTHVQLLLVLVLLLPAADHGASTNQMLTVSSVPTRPWVRRRRCCLEEGDAREPRPSPTKAAHISPLQWHSMNLSSNTYKKQMTQWHMRY